MAIVLPYLVAIERVKEMNKGKEINHPTFTLLGRRNGVTMDILLP